MAIALAAAIGGAVAPVRALVHPVRGAQAQASPLPSFEAASVKRNTSDVDATIGGVQPGGRVMLFNAPLQALIRNAYMLQDRQIEGAPAWIRSERYDIEAKAPGDLPLPRPTGTPGPVQLMMRSLLADRFKLAVHEEVMAGLSASASGT